MRVKRVGESFHTLESKRTSLDLEKIVVENITALEVGLSKGYETKKYWVSVYYLANLEEQAWGSLVVYKSENFKNKKKAKKEYNRVLKELKNGNYILKSDLRGYLGLEFSKMKESEGYHAITIFAKMLRESLENKE